MVPFFAEFPVSDVGFPHFYVKNCQKSSSITKSNAVINTMLVNIHRYVARYQHFRYYWYSDIDFNSDINTLN